MNIQEIEEYVKKNMSEKRFYHSQCVSKKAEEIAKKVGYDVQIAKKVGMAHDIAKEMTEEEKLKYIKENNITIDKMEYQNTGLLHAKIGADIAMKKLEFTKEMGQAIRAHTTGIPNMTLLDKILFIADRTSMERKFPDIDYLNRLLDDNIDKAVLYIIDKKIMLQIDKRATMHPDSIIARNWLIENGNI